MTARILDLDAARREAEQPDGLPVVFKGHTFTLPAELPVDVFDPFLADDFDLAGLIRDAMKFTRDDEGKARPMYLIVTDTLFKRPTIPVDIAKAIFAAFEALFGEEQYAEFKTLRPSLPDYGRLTSGLFQMYGVSLGEAFASLDSSGTDGATPNQTSPDSTSSTPEASGGDPVSGEVSQE